MDYYKRIIDAIYDDVRSLPAPIKLSISGGEPTLFPQLSELLEYSKDLGFITSIITNGSRPDKIAEVIDKLDWVGVSIDSAFENVEKVLGRGSSNHVENAIKTVKIVKQNGVKLKINTVVNKLNYKEDICSNLIKKLDPDRWKVFKIEIIKEVNGDAIYLDITDEEFEAFLELNKVCCPVSETNIDMRESYIMIDPYGRVFQNKDGNYQFSRKTIMESGFFAALEEVGFNIEKFVKRGGAYGI